MQLFFWLVYLGAITRLLICLIFNFLVSYWIQEVQRDKEKQGKAVWWSKSENIQYLSIKCAILLMCLKSHDSNIKDHWQI